MLEFPHWPYPLPKLMVIQLLARSEVSCSYNYVWFWKRMVELETQWHGHTMTLKACCKWKQACLQKIHLLVCSAENFLNITVSTINLRNSLLSLLWGTVAWHGIGVVYANLKSTWTWAIFHLHQLKQLNWFVLLKHKSLNNSSANIWFEHLLCLLE